MLNAASDLLKRLRSWTEDRDLVKDDTACRLSLAAIDAFERVLNGATMDCDSLSTLCAAMGCAEAAVTTAEIMSLLAADHQPVRDLIMRLVKKGNDDARTAARWAATWHDNLPRSFVVDVLRIALSDPIRELRMGAAADAARWCLAELVPAMVEMRTALSPGDDAEWLDRYIALARDGYLIEALTETDAEGLRSSSDDARARFPGKVYVVRVQVRGHHSLDGGLASESELQDRGAAAIADEIRQRVRREECRSTSAGTA